MPGDILNDTDRLNVCRFVSQVDDAIESGKSEKNYNYSKVVGERRLTKSIKCKWGKGQRFAVWGHSSNFAMLLSDPQRPLMLLPLIRKTWDHTARAIEQLIAYDQNDSHQKWILINWQKPPDFRFDDTLCERYRTTIPVVDNILKAINQKLHIHLLGV